MAVHLLVDEPLEQLGVVRSFARAATFKFSVHRINQWWITRNRERPAPEIVAAFDGPWRPGKISKMLGPKTGIRAVVIHHQDMRRALGIPRVVPEQGVGAALDVVLTPRGSTNLGSCQRAADLPTPRRRHRLVMGQRARGDRPGRSDPHDGGGPPGCPGRPVRRRTPVLAGRVTQPRAAG